MPKQIPVLWIMCRRFTQDWPSDAARFKAALGVVHVYAMYIVSCMNGFILLHEPVCQLQ